MAKATTQTQAELVVFDSVPFDHWTKGGNAMYRAKLDNGWLVLAYAPNDEATEGLAIGVRPTGKRVKPKAGAAKKAAAASNFGV